MTAEELCNHFNDTFGMYQWPKTFVVDEETYCNCLHEVVRYKIEKNSANISTTFAPIYQVSILFGPNQRLLFRNIELILKEKI